MPNFKKAKGYAMQMDKPKVNSNNNFNNKAETLMAASSMYMIGKSSENTESAPALKHRSGTSYGYKYDPSNKYTVKGGIRENFNQAFKQAREGGFDTFSFGYDRNKDGTISFQQGEVKRYTTKLKGEK